MKSKIQPNEFVPQSPADLLGAASKLAAAVTAHARRIKSTEARLKSCFYGPPGTGKTSLANMIAETLASHPLEIERTNGRNVTIEVVREWQMQSAYRSLFGGWTIKIINELDLVPMAAQELMLSYLDELRPRAAIIGTSNEDTGTLSERFKSRFQLAKVSPPDQSDLNRWLVKRWKLPRSAADWIVLSSCGNVREALLQAASFLQFGILPEEKKNARESKPAKCASRIAAANKYWEDVRAGLRPAPGTAVAQ